MVKDWQLQHQIACEAFFHQTIVSIQNLPGSLDSKITLITLANGKKYVAKPLKQKSWLGFRDKKTLEFSESVAAVVEKKLHITFAAFCWNDQYLIPFQDERLLYIPYCEGHTCSRWTASQSFLLGAQLAAIHQLQLPKMGALPYPDIQIKNKGISAVFINEIQHCNQNLTHDMDHWLTSHRDIHHGNVVWQDKTSPYLIDWESAGLIHPFIELFGLAINCAGVASGTFINRNYKAALCGYRHQASELPYNDEILWGNVYHSWLLWLAFCVEQNHQMDVERTIQSMHIINKKLIYMQKTYSAA